MSGLDIDLGYGHHFVEVELIFTFLGHSVFLVVLFRRVYKEIFSLHFLTISFTVLPTEFLSLPFITVLR